MQKKNKKKKNNIFVFFFCRYVGVMFDLCERNNYVYCMPFLVFTKVSSIMSKCVIKDSVLELGRSTKAPYASYYFVGRVS